MNLTFKRRSDLAKLPYLSSIIGDKLVLIGLSFQNVQTEHL